MRWLPTLLLAILAACSEGGAEVGDLRPSERSPEPSHERPMRIVSLDFCADQYVLKFVERTRILAISPNATKRFSYMRDEAVGVPTVRAQAEDVLILKPDLVVRAYGGGPNATAFFEKAGVPVLNIGWASDIDSETVQSITGIIAHVAEGLGSPEKGEAVIAEFRQRLAAVSSSPKTTTALYMTPSGVTTGPGSLVHQMMKAAGLENFQEFPGWRPLPLERLVYEQPDVVAAAFFDALTNHPDAWAATRHPVARRQMRDRRVVNIEGAWTACAGWFAIEAIEAMAAGSAGVE